MTPMDAAPGKLLFTGRKLRRFQYGLRSLLIVVTLFAIPCAYAGWQAKIARNRLAIRQRLEPVQVYFGGRIGFNSADHWVRNLLGDGYVFVIFIPLQVTQRESIRQIRAAFPEAELFSITPRKLTRIID